MRVSMSAALFAGYIVVGFIVGFILGILASFASREEKR
jgi:galactitol-specific phosphotransferase system IIC component